MYRQGFGPRGSVQRQVLNLSQERPWVPRVGNHRGFMLGNVFAETVRMRYVKKSFWEKQTYININMYMQFPNSDCLGLRICIYVFFEYVHHNYIYNHIYIYIYNIIHIYTCISEIVGVCLVCHASSLLRGCETWEVVHQSYQPTDQRIGTMACNWSPRIAAGAAINWNTHTTIARMIPVSISCALGGGTVPSNIWQCKASPVKRIVMSSELGSATPLAAFHGDPTVWSCPVRYTLQLQLPRQVDPLRWFLII